MADESMEIATDLGHEQEQGVADDYLDLDIDFTTGQPDDEELMEDDVAPTQELGDEHMHSPRQSSYPVGGDDIMQSPHHGGGDDLMLDDMENADQMYDEDLLGDEPQHLEHHMEDEAPSHSFVTVNEAYNDYSEHPETSAITGGGIDELTDLNWENDETLALEYTEINAQVDESFQQEDVDDPSVHENEAEHHADTASNRDSQTASPRQNSQEEQVAAAEPGSPSASDQGHQTASRDGSPDSYNQDQTQNEVLQENSAESNAHVEHKNSRAYKGITVVYREMEYSLFGAASDDSDSYFLSDLSLAEKPVSDLFKEIRNVLSFEVLEQEELCLSIKHLGLDIEEVSCPLYDVTISQILDLHKKFLINDEIMLHPLSMHLWTRVSFAKRFAYLVAAAANGKSLSELDVLNKDSLQYNNSGDASEDAEDHGALVEEEIIEEHLNLQVESINAQAEEDEIQYNIEQADDEQQEENAEEEEDDYYYEENEDGVNVTVPADPAHASEEEAENQFSEEYENGINDSGSGDPPSEVEGEEATRAQESSHVPDPERIDDDGDLIDYSDNELDITASHTGKARPKTGTADFVENSDAINKELERRSLSISHAEGGSPENLQEVYTDETLAAIVSNEDQTERNEDDWNGNQEENYENIEGGDVIEFGGMENQDDIDLSVRIDQEEDRLVEGASAGLDEFAEVEDIFDDHQQYFDHVDEEEAVEVAPTSEFSNINPSENIAGVDSRNGTKNTSDSALAHAETDPDVNSSATASLDAHHHDELTEEDFNLGGESNLETPHGNKKVALEEAGDEIDYDDDDYAEGLSTPSNEEHPNLLVASNSSSGKRPWQDLDDTSIELNNDAKRIRS